MNEFVQNITPIQMSGVLLFLAIVVHIGLSFTLNKLSKHLDSTKTQIDDYFIDALSAPLKVLVWYGWIYFSMLQLRGDFPALGKIIGYIDITPIFILAWGILRLISGIEKFMLEKEGNVDKDSIRLFTRLIKIVFVFAIILGVAQFNGYASDITRTWCAQNRKFQELIAAVDSIQQLLCSLAVKGTDFVELNDQAHRLVAEILSKQKFVLCSATQAYETGITRTFFPHGLGHLLGLQVHDVGGLQKTSAGVPRPPPAKHPHLRLTRVLEPGFVLTIEPGIYFIPMLLKKLSVSTQKKHINWDLIEEFIPFGGVRIEDNIVVTDSGICNLTRQFLPSKKAVSIFR